MKDGKPVLLQILPALNSGGVERGTVDIAKAALNSGFYSMVASSGGAQEGILERAGVEHIKLPLDSKNPFTIRKNIKRLVKIIMDYDVDIIDVRSRAPAWSAVKAADITRVPIVTSFHGFYNFGNPFKKKYNKIMTEGDMVVAVSNSIAEHIHKDYGIQKHKIKTIHRGCDLHAFDPEKVNSPRIQQLLEKLQLPEDKKIIFMPARFTEWKGHFLMLDALAQLGNQDYICLMSGDMDKHPGYIERLNDKIHELNLKNRIWIRPNIEDIAAAYAISEIVVVPSIEPEAFGRVAIEAQAMKRPVIASGIGGSKETIIDGDTGYLFDPVNADELTKKIKHVIEMPDNRKKAMGEAARINVEEHFSLKLMRIHTIGLYREMLADVKARRIKVVG